MVLRKLLACAISLTLAALAGPVQAQGSLNIYNWNDYIGKRTVADFSRAQQVKVRYDMFDANETLQAKLLTGRSGYDIVVPSLDFTARQIEAGLYLKLDKHKLPNWDNLDPAILEKLRKADPNNEYLVPYMWGTTAFGINVAAVKKALGDLPMPEDRWALLFDPKYTSRLKACGISYIDAGSEVYPMVNLYRGVNIDDASAATLEANNAVLRQVRKDIRVFNSSPIDLLANGDVCVAMAFSGDVIQARNRAREAHRKVEIEYMVPGKGSEMWVDVMAIPKDARNVDNAHRWIDYLLQPEVIAGISNQIGYVNANRKATALVDPILSQDPQIYVPAARLSTLHTKTPLSREEQRRLSVYFNRFKTHKGS